MAIKVKLNLELDPHIKKGLSVALDNALNTPQNNLKTEMVDHLFTKLKDGFFEKKNNITLKTFQLPIKDFDVTMEANSEALEGFKELVADQVADTLTPEMVLEALKDFQPKKK